LRCGHGGFSLKTVLQKEVLRMATGTVKWFNPTKGFGFIQPDNGGSDVFVHITAVKEAGLDTLNEGQKVSFDLVTERGKTAAGNLKDAA
jgi:CspA family cold shock protein